MSQRVICETSLTYRNMVKWYGEQAAQNVLTIADIIGPYCKDSFPKIKYTFQQYVIEEHGTGYLGRKLTNLFPTCPVYYPIRIENLPPNDTEGFKAAILPEEIINQVWDIAEQYPKWRDYPLTTVEPFYVAQQQIITGLTMPVDQVAKIFSAEAWKAAQAMDRFLEDCDTESPGDIPYMRKYTPYVVEQYDVNNEIAYMGIVYTNLLRGCPIIYPSYNNQFYVNRHGGYRDIALPEELVEEIWSLDMSDCNMSPL